MPGQALALVAITLGAGIVNGALGYGFSSITVPPALLFLSNRTLNPALVLIEIPLNASVLWANRAAIGVPLGAIVIRRLPPETFRRMCMSFDAWVVSFGISTLLRDMHLVASGAAYLVMAVTVLIDAYLLARFFSASRPVVVTHAA